jgi:hypothetical protein
MKIKIKQHPNGDIIIDFRWQSCFAREHEIVEITEYTIGKKYEAITERMNEFFKEKKIEGKMKI